jgi:hypothetical protein
LAVEGMDACAKKKQWFMGKIFIFTMQKVSPILVWLHMPFFSSKPLFISSSMKLSYCS